jgi:hypothetical protein
MRIVIRLIPLLIQSTENCNTDMTDSPNQNPINEHKSVEKDSNEICGVLCAKMIGVTGTINKCDDNLSSLLSDDFMTGLYLIW